MSEYSFPKATVQHRLGGKAVDLAMYSVTFGIGWLIWSLIIWGQGQTPGKQIVKLRVYDQTTGKPAKWGHMAIREFLLPLSISLAVLPLVALITFLIPEDNLRIVFVGFLYLVGFVVQLVDGFWILKGTERHRLVDIFAKTDVLNEAQNVQA
ncbi:MAG: hypothetical protein F2519_05895 [Actinobacteria bacterium]|uniref:Unannotated protein n=1 Tax=freshwater metagenome TaxID=449393 RepID=A0A6J6BT32_9ZZZZ|nr:hypothetical protein [Actinomycetota bacterium]